MAPNTFRLLFCVRSNWQLQQISFILIQVSCQLLQSLNLIENNLGFQRLNQFFHYHEIFWGHLLTLAQVLILVAHSWVAFFVFFEHLIYLIDLVTEALTKSVVLQQNYWILRLWDWSSVVVEDVNWLLLCKFGRLCAFFIMSLNWLFNFNVTYLSEFIVDTVLNLTEKFV
jgi:hypothetical protein